jgi:hypothetical protein
MMVPFQLSTLPSRRGKTAAERRAKSSAYPLQMPLFSGERVLPPCRRMALSPFPGVDRVITLLAGQPLRLCGENIDQPLALWQPWAFPGDGRCPASGSLSRAGLQYHDQRGRASATVQVVSDLQCPASGGRLCSTRRGIWPGDAARPAAALLARWIPAESASCGQQWTPAAGGDRAQIIVRRDDILQLSRCTFAPRGADRLKNIVTQGVVSGI